MEICLPRSLNSAPLTSNVGSVGAVAATCMTCTPCRASSLTRLPTGVTRRKLQNALHRQGAQQNKERNFLCYAIVMSTEDEANVEVEGGQGPRCRSSRKNWPHGSPKASHIRPSHLCLVYHRLRHQHAQHLGLEVAKISPWQLPALTAIGGLIECYNESKSVSPHNLRFGDSQLVGVTAAVPRCPRCQRSSCIRLQRPSRCREREVNFHVFGMSYWRLSIRFGFSHWLHGAVYRGCSWWQLLSMGNSCLDPINVRLTNQ